MNFTILALDWGKKKVGFATGDSEGLALTPRGSFKRKDHSKHWALNDFDRTKIRALIEEFQAEALILGIPVNTRGEERDEAQSARSLALDLKNEFKLPTFSVVETLTSWEARSRGGNEDAQAAALLIEDYLREEKMKKTRAKSNPKSNGSIKNILLVLFALFVLVGAAAYKFYYDFHSKPITKFQEELIVDVPPQSTFFSVRNSLAAQGIQIDRFAYRLWTLLNGAEKKLRVGEYKIQKNWTARKVLDEILAGQTLLHKVVIIEGHNIYDIEKTFLDTKFGNPESQIMSIFRDSELMKKMGVPNFSSNPNASLEGFLFPETYSYQKYDSPRKLVEAMLDQFKKRALPILEKHAWAKTPEGLYRLLILASMIEKESGQASEQPLIASVFWNRLSKKMKLQSDPTTIYALFPNFDGNLRRIHLQTPSDYNTYTLPELPIAPIANPGESALKAVVEPANSNYFYFVGRGDGSHAFSEDYATHNRYVRQFQLGLAPATPPPSHPQVNGGAVSKKPRKNRK